MNLHDIKNIRQLLNNHPTISIIPHTSPDGDAIGSCLGLYHFLKAREYDVEIVSPTDFPDFLKWLPGVENIIIFPNDEQKAKQRIENSELIFTLDFNNLLRAKPLTELLQKSSASFVMIDHHQQPDTYAEVMYSEPTASSTCELIYKFIDMLGEQNSIDKTIATCLYTGIMTDTGGFRYSLTSATTHRITAFLVDKGANCSQISSNIFESQTHDRLLLLGKALENLVYLPDYQTSYISLSSKELKQYNFKKGDTEGVVNYGLRIKEAELAAIFIENEEEGIVKISFRSKSNIDVNLLARTYFNGGGHINAAGGMSTDSLQETIEKFLKILPEFLASPDARNYNI
jgi:DHH subfamily 1 protein